MEYYVSFTAKNRETKEVCFANHKDQADRFAKIVNGKLSKKMNGIIGIIGMILLVFPLTAPMFRKNTI